MASEGPQSPTASAVIAGTWTNPSYVYSSGDNYAEADNNTDIMAATGYDFSGIPDGSVITGIVVSIEGYGEGNNAARRDLAVGLTKDGSTQAGDESATADLDTSDTPLIDFGAADSLWNTTWNLSDIKGNSSFGCRLRPGTQSGASYTRFVDHATITVYYEAGAQTYEDDVVEEVGSEEVVSDTQASFENRTEEVGSYEATSDTQFMSNSVTEEVGAAIIVSDSLTSVWSEDVTEEVGVYIGETDDTGAGETYEDDVVVEVGVQAVAAAWKAFSDDVVVEVGVEEPGFGWPKHWNEVIDSFDREDSSTVGTASDGLHTWDEVCDANRINIYSNTLEAVQTASYWATGTVRIHEHQSAGHGLDVDYRHGGILGTPAYDPSDTSRFDFMSRWDGNRTQNSLPDVGYTARFAYQKGAGFALINVYIYRGTTELDSVSSPGVTVTTGSDKLEFRVRGTSLTALYNGEVLLDTTDATHTEGQTGVALDKGWNTRRMTLASYFLDGVLEPQVSEVGVEVSCTDQMTPERLYVEVGVQALASDPEPTALISVGVDTPAYGWPPHWNQASDDFNRSGEPGTMSDGLHSWDEVYHGSYVSVDGSRIIFGYSASITVYGTVRIHEHVANGHGLDRSYRQGCVCYHSGTAYKTNRNRIIARDQGDGNTDTPVGYHVEVRQDRSTGDPYLTDIAIKRGGTTLSNDGSNRDCNKNCEFRVWGTKLQAFWDGELMTQTTDATYSEGCTGIGGKNGTFSGSSKADNYYLDELLEPIEMEVGVEVSVAEHGPYSENVAVEVGVEVAASDPEPTLLVEVGVYTACSDSFTEAGGAMEEDRVEEVGVYVTESETIFVDDVVLDLALEPVVEEAGVEILAASTLYASDAVTEEVGVAELAEAWRALAEDVTEEVGVHTHGFGWPPHANVCTDDFDRGDSGAVGSMSDGLHTWEEDPDGTGATDFEIDDNRLKIIAGSTTENGVIKVREHVVDGHGLDTDYSQRIWASHQGPTGIRRQYVRIHNRHQVTASGYYAYYYLYRGTSGSAYMTECKIYRGGTTLASDGTDRSNSKYAEFKTIGSGLQLYWDDELVLATEDATYSEGESRIQGTVNGWAGSLHLDNYSLSFKWIHEEVAEEVGVQAIATVYTPADEVVEEVGVYVECSDQFTAGAGAFEEDVVEEVGVDIIVSDSLVATGAEDVVEEVGVAVIVSDTVVAPEAVTEEVGVAVLTSDTVAGVDEATEEVGVAVLVTSVQAGTAAATEEVGVYVFTVDTLVGTNSEDLFEYVGVQVIAASTAWMTQDVAEEVGVAVVGAASFVLTEDRTEEVGVAVLVADTAYRSEAVTEEVGVYVAASDQQAGTAAGTEEVGVYVAASDAYTEVAVENRTEEVGVAVSTTDTQASTDSATEEVGVEVTLTSSYATTDAGVEEVGVYVAAWDFSGVLEARVEEVGVQVLTSDTQYMSSSATEEAGAYVATSDQQAMAGSIVEEVGVQVVVWSLQYGTDGAVEEVGIDVRSWSRMGAEYLENRVVAVGVLAVAIDTSFVAESGVEEVGVYVSAAYTSYRPQVDMVDTLILTVDERDGVSGMPLAADVDLILHIDEVD